MDNGSKLITGVCLILAAALIAGSNVFVGMQLEKVGMQTYKDAVNQAMGGAADQAVKAADDSENDSANTDDGSNDTPPVAPSTDNAADNVKDVSDADHVRGNKDARITLVEYSDFECPFCSRFHGTAQQVVDSYDGQVNWVYRHFPLSFHEPKASMKAEASECAAELGGNDVFWKYTDRLYADISAITDETGLAALAQELGVDKAKFTECMESDRHLSRIANDMKNGSDAGVDGTPGNILIDHKTGKKVPLIGAQPYDRFKIVIDAMLAN